MPARRADVAGDVTAGGCVGAVAGGGGIPVVVAAVGVPSTGAVVIGMTLSEGTIEVVEVVLELVVAGGVVFATEFV